MAEQLGVHAHLKRSGIKHRARLDDPLADLSLVSQEPTNPEVGRGWDAHARARAHKVARQQQLAELAVEGPNIADKAAGHRAVACRTRMLVIPSGLVCAHMPGSPCAHVACNARTLALCTLCVNLATASAQAIPSLHHIPYQISILVCTQECSIGMRVTARRSGAGFGHQSPC